MQEYQCYRKVLFIKYVMFYQIHFSKTQHYFVSLKLCTKKPSYKYIRYKIQEVLKSIVHRKDSISCPNYILIKIKAKAYLITIYRVSYFIYINTKKIKLLQKRSIPFLFETDSMLSITNVAFLRRLQNACLQGVANNKTSILGGILFSAHAQY